jgi:hypothetical protein
MTAWAKSRRRRGGAIADSDKNCGQTIHETIAINF